MKRIVLLSFFMVSASFLAVPAASKLTDDQKVLHLLNRIEFGPRPADIDRVRTIGIDKFLQQQLHPESIDDSAVDALLAPFPSVRMDSKDISRNYITAMDLARQMG